MTTLRNTYGSGIPTLPGAKSTWVSLLLIALGLAMPGSNSWAGTIVAVQTSLGDFYIEVNEQAAPVTAENFLNYVRSGRYDNTFVHGVSGGAQIRGGCFRFGNCNDGPQSIQLDPAIPLEPTGLSNIQGSIAALHPSTDPDGATSQWLISLGNDSALDTLNGGYAVFGKVLGDGLSVLQQIASANPVRLGFFEETPTVNYLETNIDCQQFSRDNLVLLFMSVVNEDSTAATADYDPAGNRLQMNIDLGREGFRRIDFAVEQTGNETLITARLASALVLAEPAPNMATYNDASGILSIPFVAVGGDIVFRNVEFELRDRGSASFVLRRAE